MNVLALLGRIGRALLQGGRSSPPRHDEDLFLSVLFVGELRLLAQATPLSTVPGWLESAIEAVRG